MAAPFSEFAGNKRLLWIAHEWEERADELAQWAMERLVNRRDVWSQYTLRGDKIGVVMLPIAERRALGVDMVTLQKLRRHFAGRSRSHLIGLHAFSDHNTAKWFAVDIDLHDKTVANADELAAANLAACLTWAGRLREKYFDPCVIDSNGAGGYHLWTLLDREYPLEDVFQFVSDLRDDWANFGLTRKPEVFPPKGHVEPGHLPYGLRLPGRHHTNHHYSRVWNFDSIGDSEWLEGAEAIEALISLRPAPLPVRPRKKSSKKGADKEETSAPKTADLKQKPRVCVDLDGVLAKYDRWRGAEHIGAPVPGALEFAQELAKFADIIIFSTRCSEDRIHSDGGYSLSPAQMRIHIIDWLEKHKFPYTDVYLGKGKPSVAAFIDDRAVPCSPQKDKEAFENALDSVKSLLKRKRT
ncbi:MAG: hypothetical protein J2P21_10640 [Chloracidobacterium sp.]|nr:hypothetical protein [Chloracidobacterium sp.]